jgi:serine/threonine protein kinase
MTSSHRSLGRYLLFGEIAAGGMAAVHFGRLLGAVGFARTVAIKRLRRAASRDPQFVAMLIDEARLASRIRHPNVAATIDAFEHDGELFLVMEYVHGESLRGLMRTDLRKRRRVDPRIAAGIVCGALHGLHAAHEAQSETGEPLDIVHRDVSPQNVMVGLDGLVRVVDFGIARATHRLQHTREGQLKGKVTYMAPEQLDHRGAKPDRRTDIFTTGIVLWEALTGERLFKGDTEISVMQSVLDQPIPAPSSVNPSVPPSLDRVVLRALSRDMDLRYQRARDFLLSIEDALPTGIASQYAIGAWVEREAGPKLAALDAELRDVEHSVPFDAAEARRSLVAASERPPPDDAANEIARDDDDTRTDLRSPFDELESDRS